MAKEIEIPEGYDARIEGNKVIIELAESKDEKIRKEIVAALRQLDTEKSPVDTYHYLEWADWLEKQKEQKPDIELIQRSWYLEGYNDRKFGKEPKWIIKTGEGGPKHELNPKYGQPLAEEQKPAENNEKELLYVCNKSYKIGYRDGRRDAQKPAEWSEEDEEHINSILERLEGMCKKGATFTQTRFAVSEDEDWLKSLRPQPKQEWSEEDETAFGDLMWCIEQARKSAKDENDMGNIWFAENWLKKKLKSLRPQPHWKPSEEQMDTLKRVFYNRPIGTHVLAVLESLYSDLSKL